MLGLGLQARLEDGRPPTYQSVLLVCGLLLLGPALLEVADVLGADYGGLSAGPLVWTSLVWCGVALYPAVHRNSAVCGMIAAVTAGIAWLAACGSALGARGEAAYRWLLLVLAVAYVLAALALRGRRPRHAELLVAAAGLATLAIAIMAIVRALGVALDPFERTAPGALLPGFWELVLLVAGCGLIAYGAVDRVPGAAWLGLTHLLAFVVAAGAGAEPTLRWWPLVLLLLGAGAMAAGLRPRGALRPDPEPHSVDRPPASRADGEVVLRVRNDDPPGR